MERPGPTASNVTPGASLLPWTATPTLTVGVFALDTSGINNTATWTAYEADMFASRN